MCAVETFHQVLPPTRKTSINIRYMTSRS